MSEEINDQITVPAALAGKRVDQIAAELFPQYSRARLQIWIKSGCLLVDGVPRKSKEKLWGEESLTLEAELHEEGDWIAQPIPIDVIYEDDYVIVVNKPSGLVVHPAAGHADGTLLNALLYHYPELVNLPRAGVVHRLDKETTGLMVVARNLIAHASLVNQLQEKTAQRHYQAVVIGAMTGGGKVDQPIGRHRSVRTRMAVIPGGKAAVTHYRLMRRFRDYTHLDISLETGRTHQIRVHMSSIHYPLVGDPLYSGRPRLPAGASPELINTLQSFKRQALHAYRLGIVHPHTQEEIEWEAPLPADFVGLLSALEIADQ